MTNSDIKRQEAEDRRFDEAERVLAHEEAVQDRRENIELRRAELEERRAATAGLTRYYTGEVTERPEDARWSAVTALVVSAAVTVVVLATLVGLLILLDRTTSGPESALSLVFVAAAVVLILVVCTLTIVLKRLRLTNSDEAMGLPRGSIRAVIALMLILLFFIAAIFLFNTTRDARDPDKVRDVQGLSQASFDAISPDLIVESERQEDAGEITYDVTLYQVGGSTPTSDDLAKQLVTVLGTLVTAVAAFYFGANSVHDAKAPTRGTAAIGAFRPRPPGTSGAVAPPPPSTSGPDPSRVDGHTVEAAMAPSPPNQPNQPNQPNPAGSTVSQTETAPHAGDESRGTGAPPNPPADNAVLDGDVTHQIAEPVGGDEQPVGQPNSPSADLTPPHDDQAVRPSKDRESE